MRSIARRVRRLPCLLLPYYPYDFSSNGDLCLIAPHSPDRGTRNFTVCSWKCEILMNDWRLPEELTHADPIKDNHARTIEGGLHFKIFYVCSSPATKKTTYKIVTSHSSIVLIVLVDDYPFYWPFTKVMITIECCRITGLFCTFSQTNNHKNLIIPRRLMSNFLKWDKHSCLMAFPTTHDPWVKKWGNCPAL